MHELGHAIGIIILDENGNEIYCEDPECVMARLSPDNADNYFSWHYCSEHWATKDLEYYTASTA